ncbi:MAG: hypothetical protein R3E12_19600 [Candidatus Eisenbacteria bacterium]
MQFSAENQKTFQHLLTRYPTKQAIAAHALAGTEVRLDLGRGHQIHLRLLDLPPSHVYGVVSFYTMFYRKPIDIISSAPTFRACS